MKKIIVLLSILLCAGCASYEGNTLEDFMNDRGSFLKDPHYGSYQEKRDELEHQYLQKKITYPEYVEKLKELDNKYTQEVEERNRIIETGE